MKVALIGASGNVVSRSEHGSAYMHVDLLPLEAYPSLRDRFLALTFYVIRDLEFPRLPGLVGMNDIDNVMVDLRMSMH